MSGAHDEVRRVYFRVRGVVQGVGYRASACEEAQRHGLVGWVRNRGDGDVEGEAAGADAAIDRFVAWCRGGPPGARVDEVNVEEIAAVPDADGFEIRR